MTLFIILVALIAISFFSGLNLDIVGGILGLLCASSLLFVIFASYSLIITDIRWAIHKDSLATVSPVVSYSYEHPQVAKLPDGRVVKVNDVSFGTGSETMVVEYKPLPNVWWSWNLSKAQTTLIKPRNWINTQNGDSDSISVE